MTDYFRPRGDITTVLDLTDRDSQDNTYFPLNTNSSYFHRGGNNTIYPSATSVQEFTQRGPADWGQKLSFELGSLPAGDLLEAVILQFNLGSWYDGNTINRLSKGEIQANTSAAQFWTYMNSLGTAIIEYAEFIVNDQTIERITGEFIRAFFNVYADINNLVGISTDGTGTTPVQYTAIPYVLETQLNPNRPYPTENGTYFCILPFFFIRTRLKEVFPLLSCNENTVRIDIKLRPFDQVIRRYIGYRESCTQTPLNSSVTFNIIPEPLSTTTIQTATQPPQFRDFRIVTVCPLITGTLREKYLRKPFEQMVKLAQTFHFEEPLKYIVSKPTLSSGTVEIQLPLELNHPTVELLWVFRRKAVLINNEWANFTPAIGLESDPSKIYPPWLDWATIRINGSELISADGNWFREHIASSHRGGLISYNSHTYGYTFAKTPEDHQPSGTANMSRATSVTLNLRVNQPIAKDLSTLSPPCVFDSTTVGGWEVFIFAIHYNWLRFENGICNRMFTD
jgi:Large eukaryotic DNA virus major capsid protein/Major capsid protein N-terminus